MHTLADTPASARQRNVALAISVVLAAAAIAASRFATHPWPTVAAFLPIFATLASAADGFTAFLLFSQARVARSIPLLILAMGYLFSAVAIVAQLLVFPGVFSDHGLLGAGAQTAVWFWVWWHGGFPLFVIAYAIVTSRFTNDGRSEPLHRPVLFALSALVVAFVAALLATTIRLEPLLPVLIEKSRYGLLVSSHVGPVVVALIALAIGILARVTRLRTVTHLWLAVALFASFLDCLLTLGAGERYTVGWYVARAESLGTSTFVLLTFLGALDGLFSQLSRLSWVDGLGARYGGEEFAAILPGTDSRGAQRVANRIRDLVRVNGLTYPQSPFGTLTVSVGVATFPGSSLHAAFDPSELLDHADAALYRAKATGRNGVVAVVSATPPILPADASTDAETAGRS
jgi:hypothetical protein